MSGEGLAKAISNGHFVVTAEYVPPRGSDTAKVKAAADALKGSADAIFASESQDGVRMSSLAACGHLAAAGAEPVLSLLTRDQNRIALQASILGASSMGVHGVMCMTGRHQALTTSGTAKGVFDLDPIQLLRVADAMRKSGQLADGQQMDSPVELVLGIDTNPFSDPAELQIIALDKAVAAGADFVITQPVFNIGRFAEWMNSVRERGIHTKTCILAGVMPLSSAEEARSLAEKYSHLDIPANVIERLQDQSAGLKLATETIEALKRTEGVRGVHIMAGEDPGLAAKVIADSGLSRS